MSGGVDSSVAALLLKRRGCDVAGAYMKNWINEDKVVGRCPWEEDIDDARRVADRVGIDFQVVNLMRDYRERVVQYLLDGYAGGLTPNPDALCNREIKFGVFLAWARDRGFDAVATGHYAQRGHASYSAVSSTIRSMTPLEGMEGTEGMTPSEGSAFSLLEGADKDKDQSYFLALLGPGQLAGARFPIGHLSKPELRDIARAEGLATADKRDSQGICFIGEVKMSDFLRAYVPDKPGPIVRAEDGRELGLHRGLHYFTLGQRRGIRVPSNTDNERYVVVGKRAGDNALLVAFDGPRAPGLFQTEARIHSLSWTGEPVCEARPLEGRVRYRDPRVGLDFIPEGPSSALVRFHRPQRAIAAGQVLAIHDGERVLGGGIYS